MKKVFLKRLQSLTAILVLNTVPFSFAQTDTSVSRYDVEVIQANVLTDDRKNISKNTDSQKDSLKQLYFDNSLAYIQKHTEQTASYQHQVALALVEEAYQDDYDTLLDQYERELENAVASNDQGGIENAKSKIESQLQDLKTMRLKKIAEFNQQFGMSSSFSHT
ncbi:hypothetical protein C0J08_11420 [Marinomonas sp. CT5]|uniref:hypothetical protein n=1 Tax=Marinomonas sp. CT5 TaxID=2066133 RepID=UPI0018379E81|nr:hypothetical protein [Marinomonas sp. CT5]NVK72915.1 hypothetical protein [Oceanospirillaceae bacterium]QUX95979.1 hypothetical protein C0J08_11420 [Marinomonas sp. CT5]